MEAGAALPDSQHAVDLASATCASASCPSECYNARSCEAQKRNLMTLHSTRQLLGMCIASLHAADKSGRQRHPVVSMT